PKAQKADLPYRGTKKSDSKTDFRFVFSDPENLGYTTVSKIDSNFRYYGHPWFEISRHRLLNVLCLPVSAISVTLSPFSSRHIRINRARREKKNDTKIMIVPFKGNFLAPF